MDNKEYKVELRQIKSEIRILNNQFKKLESARRNNVFNAIEQYANVDLSGNREEYFRVLDETERVLKEAIRKQNEKIIELEKRRKQENQAIREIIAEQRNYSTKTNEELEKEYRYIRGQIKKIAKKIWSVCEHHEVSTYYKFNEVGEIKLVSADKVSEATMLYDMNQILEDLETRLSSIEEYYTGTNLKEMPVLDESFFQDEVLDDYDIYLEKNYGSRRL